MHKGLNVYLANKELKQYNLLKNNGNSLILRSAVKLEW